MKVTDYGGMYASHDWFETYVHVVDCNNGEVEKCDFSDLTSGPNFPIVAQELVIGGDCPPGVIPEIPAGVRVGFYAPDGIRFLDGFHVVADPISNFIARPMCPVTNEDQDTDNSIVINDSLNNGPPEIPLDFESVNINSSRIDESLDYYIYPNPTNDKFVIQTLSPLNFPMVIKIYDMLGNIVKYTNGFSNKITVDLSDFVMGVYFVKFNYNDRVFNEKVVLH